MPGRLELPNTLLGPETTGPCPFGGDRRWMVGLLLPRLVVGCGV
jgi:hypothetical protein